MSSQNRTFFFPTFDSHFNAVLTGYSSICAISLYELARFVEDYVLVEKIYLEHEAYHILDSAFNNYSSEGGASSCLGPLSELVNNTSVNENDGVKIRKIAKSFYHEIGAGPYSYQDVVINYLKNGKSCAQRKLHPEALPVEDIEKTSETLKKYPISLSPGFGFIKSFLKEGENVNDGLYDEVVKRIKADVDSLNKISSTQISYIPPLLAILLSRCKSPEDILPQLVLLRIEFSDLRKMTNEYYKQLNESKNLKEKLLILDELEAKKNALSKKLSRVNKTTIVRRTWNIVKSGNPVKMLTNIADTALEWDEERSVYCKVSRYSDIYSVVVNDIKEYDKLIPKIFGDNGVDYKSFELLEPYLNDLKNSANRSKG